MPEEDTFAVLVKIMQDYRMREMFKPSMAELGEWRQCRPCLYLNAPRVQDCACTSWILSYRNTFRICTSTFRWVGSRYRQFPKLLKYLNCY